MPIAFYKSENRDFSLLQGDCVELLNSFDFEFDMIFADPPYHLSNDGISIQSGKVVSVNKGQWDKTNPPPNVSCRYFTYSAEYILWARKERKTPHFFNYELMKEINGGTQMRDVWTLPSIAPWEKSCGKHPTQKPLCVLSRIILASTRPGAWVLDPFAGSSTTGVAASLLGRRFLGIDQEDSFLEISKARREELNSIKRRGELLGKLEKQAKLFQDKDIRVLNESEPYYGPELPF